MLEIISSTRSRAAFFAVEQLLFGVEIALQTIEEKINGVGCKSAFCVVNYYRNRKTPYKNKAFIQSADKGITIYEYV